jgi:hypothetical protein
VLAGQDQRLTGLARIEYPIIQGPVGGLLAPELQAFLALSRSIENVTLCLDNEI